jgi:uncharacterized repeat protein (TIGR03809 family)
MPETQGFRRYAQAMQKWRDLVERRSAHFVELHASGRWRHYYTKAQFLALLREAVELAEMWSQMAPRPEDAEQARPLPPTQETPRRSAA